MSAPDDGKRAVPDLADVDEDAPTNLHVPDLSADSGGDATEIAALGAGPEADAATVVSVNPAGAAVGPAERDRPALGDPTSALSSNTATKLVDLAEPDVPTGPDPAREVAKEIRLPEADERRADGTARFDADDDSAPPNARRGAKRALPVLLVLGSLVVAALVVGVTLALIDEEVVAPDAPQDPVPLAPVEVGEPAGTVYATSDGSGSDLERRGADLVAAGRFAEAVSVYEAMLEGQPGRREIEIALEVLRRRSAEAER